MYPMQHALARERMRDMQERAARMRLSRELASANRWQYLAKRAQQRHALRAQRVAEVSALAVAR